MEELIVVKEEVKASGDDGSLNWVASRMVVDQSADKMMENENIYLFSLI